MASAGQASQQSSAKTLSSGVLPGTRLRTGKVPLGKAFGLGQKAANQPAFIRIGGDTPRTVRNATQPAVATVSAQGKALLQPAVAHAAALHEVSSTASPAGPAAGPTAAAAALPATSGAVTAADLTSGSAAKRPPTIQQGGQTEHMPGIAPEGRDTVYAAIETSPAGALASSSSNSRAHTSLPLLSKATDQRAAALATTAQSHNGNAAVTAAPNVLGHSQVNFVTQEAMPIQFAASAAPVLVEATEASSPKSVNLATASAAVMESSAANAANPLYSGDVTPEPAAMQSPVGQQLLLPTSRRKRKGRKAAKVAEPARGNSTWQELAELSGAAEPAAALAGEAMLG